VTSVLGLLLKSVRSTYVVAIAGLKSKIVDIKVLRNDECRSFFTKKVVLKDITPKTNTEKEDNGLVGGKDFEEISDILIMISSFHLSSLSYTRC